MNIVFFLSCNGIAPAIIAGTILENLKLIIKSKHKLILKTNDKLRYDLLYLNYNKNLKLDIHYKIKKSDFVFHIIDPRNINTCGKDIFIDCLGDYWQYIRKKNLFGLRSRLYFEGLNKADYFFGTSLLRKTVNGKKLYHFGFIDNYIKQKQFNMRTKNEIIFIGSYKTKNENYDQMLKNDVKLNFFRSLNRKDVCVLIHKAKYVIVHPGINVITESLYLKKPFLYIAPANVEQTHNAKIITRYKLGVVVINASSDNILKGINKLKRNYKLYEKNINNFCLKQDIYFEKKLNDFLKMVYYENYRKSKL